MNHQAQSQTQIRSHVGAYLISLLTFPLFFLANYLFNHQRALLTWLPQGRPVYFLAVLLPFGTILPSLALGWLIRRQKNAYSALTLRGFMMALIGFAMGSIAIYFALREKVAFNLTFWGSAIHYFIWLLMASIPETLVFIGIVFYVTEGFVQSVWSGKVGVIVGAISGIIISAIAFGLFHFSYPAPWNTWEKIMILIPVWIAVAALYAITRSLIATVIYDNMMAMIGFLLYNLSLPGNEILGLVLDCIAIVTTVTIIVLVSRSANKRVISAQSAG